MKVQREGRSEARPHSVTTALLFLPLSYYLPRLATKACPVALDHNGTSSFAKEKKVEFLVAISNFRWLETLEQRG